LKRKVLNCTVLRSRKLKIIQLNIMDNTIEKINEGSGMAENGYNKIETWNASTIDEMASMYKRILRLIGEDPEREGLLRTPVRVAKALHFLTLGYNQNPCEILNSAKFKEDYRQMVIVKDIDIYSMCEHHMLPFFGKAHIAYIPDGYITGLSKIARVAEAFSRRLQVQERLTTQIRDCLQDCLSPMGVAVVIEAQHMCMQIRGIQKQNSVTTTSAFTGVFLNQLNTREEFVHLIGSRLH
jgi:GTP cyclohydrolase I